MLSNDLRQTLTAVLSRRLGIPASIPMVELYLGPGLAISLPYLTTILALTGWMIDQALAQPTPDILIRMIRAVEDAAIISSKIDSLLDLATQLENDPGKWVSPTLQSRLDWALEHDPRVVGQGQPFLDRSAFRALLPRRDGNPISTPVCTVVHGEKGHGKSYLIDYCKFYATRWADLCVATFAVPTSGVREIDPGLVADELAYSLGTNIQSKPREHESASRNALNLAAWITSHVPAPPRAVPALVLLDGFDHPELPEPVHTFILELVSRATTDPAVADRLRIVLLGYPVVKLEEKGITSSKPCVLEPVGPQEVREWFQHQYPKHDDYLYDDAVEVIFDTLPEARDTRLRRICTRVRNTATAKFQQTGGQS